MRLWSIHPSYLDARGLVAFWREGLLARKVLQGKTKGYRSHPQLLRFKAQPDPVACIDQYLSVILQEADRRGYSFDHRKIKPPPLTVCIPVTSGQLEFELTHLKEKLLSRSPAQYASIARVSLALPNPIFRVVKGGIEEWEKGATKP